MQGHVGEDLTLPSLSLGLAAGTPAKVGSPLVIAAEAADGQWPVGEHGAYLWYVASRPTGSMLWLSGEFQTTTAPKLTLEPDVPGTYVVTGAVQSIDPSNPAAFAWSPHVSLSFEVEPQRGRALGVVRTDDATPWRRR